MFKIFVIIFYFNVSGSLILYGIIIHILDLFLVSLCMLYSIAFEQLTLIKFEELKSGMRTIKALIQQLLRKKHEGQKVGALQDDMELPLQSMDQLRAMELKLHSKERYDQLVCCIVK